MDFIRLIISQLPRQSEEESFASRIVKRELLDALRRVSEPQDHKPDTLVEIIEQLLDSLSLLDPEELKNGFWKFVSHPAQLCALSTLNTLADPSQKLFPADFWHTNVGDTEKQLQKKVLQSLEDRRYENHQQGFSTVLPIRFVYVAWAIIKIGDKFLFHQREASEHDTEYILVGGKAKLSDLKKSASPSVTTENLLNVIQSFVSEEMLQALEHTLARELFEEVNLSAKEHHYEASPWKDLKPYKSCMGAAPSYALTEYYFRLYCIKLSTSGYFSLRTQMKNSSRLIECSLDEFVNGKIAGGASTLRVEALYRDFNDDKKQLKNALQAIEPSFCNQYILNDEREGIIFSLDGDILQGIPGKEKPLPDVHLSSKQKELLLTLAIHGKGLAFELHQPQLATLHEYGWMEIHDKKLLTDLRELSEFLRRCDCPLIETVDTKYYRLSISPHLLYFEPKFFFVSLSTTNEDKWLLTLKRNHLLTSFIDLSEESKVFSIISTLAIQLEKVFNDELSTIEDEDLPKKVRSALKEEYQQIGLRQLMVSRDKYYTFACEKGPRP